MAGYIFCCSTSRLSMLPLFSSLLSFSGYILLHFILAMGGPKWLCLLVPFFTTLSPLPHASFFAPFLLCILQFSPKQRIHRPQPEGLILPRVNFFTLMILAHPRLLYLQTKDPNYGTSTKSYFLRSSNLSNFFRHFPTKMLFLAKKCWDFSVSRRVGFICFNYWISVSPKWSNYCKSM